MIDTLEKYGDMQILDRLDDQLALQGESLGEEGSSVDLMPNLQKMLAQFEIELLPPNAVLNALSYGIEQGKLQVTYGPPRDTHDISQHITCIKLLEAVSEPRHRLLVEGVDESQAS